MLKTNVYLTSYLLWFLILGMALMPGQSGNYGRIAFISDRDNLAQIYVMDSDGSNQVNITHNYFENSNPEWSPDGKKIVFASKRDGNWDVYVMDSDGGNVEQLTTDSAWDGNPSWSPDGEKIVFISERDEYNHIYVMDSDGRNM